MAVTGRLRNRIIRKRFLCLGWGKSTCLYVHLSFVLLPVSFFFSIVFWSCQTLTLFPPLCILSILQAFLHWWWLCPSVSQKLKDMALSTSKSQPATFGLSLFSAFILTPLPLAQALIFFFLLFSSCWLSLEGGLLYSFVGPAAAVVLVRILTLTSQSTPMHKSVCKCITIITLSHPFFSLSNRWIWSLVFWSSTSWYPRTALPTWSWRREPGRFYWSSSHTRVLRLSPSSVPLQVYWWCALISSLTIIQQERIELRNSLQPAWACSCAVFLKSYLLFSHPTGHHCGAPAWFCPSWPSPGCLLCWPSPTAALPSSRSSLLSSTLWRVSSLSWSTASCVER